MTRALVLLALLLGARAYAGPGERSVLVEVDKDGLKWTGPCVATFFYEGEEDPDLAVALVHRNLDEPASLAPGRYHLQVACPSTEGELRRTVLLKVGARDAKERVQLRPAFVVVRVVRDGKEVPAEVSVTDELGREVQRGRDKVALPVPPGRLRVMAEVDPEVSGTTRPVFGSIDLIARAGRKETPTVDTSDGTLRLVLTNNGRPAEGVGALRAPKSRVRLVEVQSGREQPVPPGVYDLATQLQESHDFVEVVRPKVRIRPGEALTVRVAHRTGRLLPELFLDGARLPDEEKVEVALFLGAAPEAFNTLSPGEEAVLSPRRYRVRARFTEKTLDDGAPWQVEAEAQVSPGRTRKVRLDLTPSRLVLKTSIGKAPEPLDVEVFAEGAEAPFLARKSGENGALELRLSPGSYRVVARKKVPQGELVTEARVFLKPQRTLERALDLDVGICAVQVFEGGVAVPAEVLFFVEGAAAPMLSLPAGQDAYLPPGTYALVVRRKGKEKSFSPVRIASGRTVVRQLELLDAEASE